MISCHCGFKPKDIDDFSYLEYKDILFELGVKLNFESMSNLYGNGYAGESYSQIQEANPFKQKIEKEAKKSAPKVTLDMIKSMGLLKDK